MPAQPNLWTPEGTAMFMYVWEPRDRSREKPRPGAAPVNANAKPRYQVSLVIPAAGVSSPQFMAIRQALSAAVVDEFGSLAQDTHFRSTLKLPIKRTNAFVTTAPGPDQGKRIKGFEDDEARVLQAWSYNAPEILLRGRPMPAARARETWAGQTVVLQVRPYAGTNQGNRFVSLNLNAISFEDLNTPRMDGRQSATASYAAAYGSRAPEPAGADDDIPF